MDKIIALRTGQPPLICNEFCNLAMPTKQNRFDATALGEPEMTCDLHLSVLQSKILRQLYSTEVSAQSNAGILHTIRELDEELESWRISLPANVRPALCVPGNIKQVPVSAPIESMDRITLLLQYHHLIAAIHRATGSCTGLLSQTGFTRSGKSGDVQSSIELAVEASRSTLVYLRAAVHLLSPQSFW